MMDRMCRRPFPAKVLVRTAFTCIVLVTGVQMFWRLVGRDIPTIGWILLYALSIPALMMTLFWAWQAVQFVAAHLVTAVGEAEATKVRRPVKAALLAGGSLIVLSLPYQMLLRVAPQVRVAPEVIAAEWTAWFAGGVLWMLASWLAAGLLVSAEQRLLGVQRPRQTTFRDFVALPIRALSIDDRLRALEAAPKHRHVEAGLVGA